MNTAIVALAAFMLWLTAAAHSEIVPARPSGARSSSGAVPAFIRGMVRFQVLAPALVRLEYSPTGAFVDAPSVAVLNRADWPQTLVRSREENGWLMLDTEVLCLRYKLDSGPFTTNNLRLEWRDALGTHPWKPGEADDRNLGGVPASLDNRSTKAVTEPGPLSRKGSFLLDDSKTALFDPASEWVKPRPSRDSLDWFFLAYGTDYKSALAQLSKLVGPVPMLPPLRLRVLVRFPGRLLGRAVETDREAVPRRAAPTGPAGD